MYSSGSPKRPPDSGPVPVLWAVGTAYDLFASLFVIRNADTTGLRKAWAAGVRNRLSVAHRDLLQILVPVLGVPVEFIGTIDGDRDGAAVVACIAALEDSEVLRALCDREIFSSELVSRVTGAREVTAGDVSEALSSSVLGDAKPANERTARDLLGLFADPERTGGLVKSAITEYYEQFFAEEEHRIAGYLSAAYDRARREAAGRSVVDLVEDLSGGLRLEGAAEATALMCIPSFWAGPLVLFEMLSDGTWVLLFSARPRDVSLIPGDPVPDTLTRSLQAVSDQTRLRILKLLAQRPRTQVEIARELRLRPPTITHHLKILRMANLVRLIESTQGEKRYDVRGARLSEIAQDLVRFVGTDRT